LHIASNFFNINDFSGVSFSEIQRLSGANTKVRHMALSGANSIHLQASENTVLIELIILPFYIYRMTVFEEFSPPKFYMQWMKH